MTPNQVFGRVWLVTAPWAHPLWNRYAITLCDLTTPSEQPAMKLRDDVTHEVVVFALDPEKEVGLADGEYTSEQLPQPLPILMGPNHGYQFMAENDEQARQRVAGLVLQIDERQLSPDTDFTTAWDVRFEDGITLRKSAWG